MAIGHLTEIGDEFRVTQDFANVEDVTEVTILDSLVSKGVVDLTGESERETKETGPLVSELEEAESATVSEIASSIGICAITDTSKLESALTTADELSSSKCSLSLEISASSDPFIMNNSEAIEASQVAI